MGRTHNVVVVLDAGAVACVWRRVDLALELGPGFIVERGGRWGSRIRYRLSVAGPEHVSRKGGDRELTYTFSHLDQTC